MGEHAIIPLEYGHHDSRAHCLCTEYSESLSRRKYQNTDCRTALQVSRVQGNFRWGMRFNLADIGDVDATR